MYQVKTAPHDFISSVLAFHPRNLLSVQVIAISALNLGQLTIGLALGFSATFIPYVQEYGFAGNKSKPVNTEQTAWIGKLIIV